MPGVEGIATESRPADGRVNVGLIAMGMRTRLQNLYGEKFGALVALTPEQLDIFNGKRVEK